MKFAVTTAPTFEPVTIADTKVHLRTVAGDTSEDDAIITPLISAAREFCENVTGRALAEQTIKAYPIQWGQWVLPNPPILTINSIKYYDENSTEYTLSTDNYQFDNVDGIVLITEVPTETLRKLNPIVIEYTAGYDTVPNAIRQAMLLLISHWYTNREATITGAVNTKIEIAVDNLLKQYKVWWF